MKQIVKVFTSFLAILFALVLLLAFACLKSLDKTPYQLTEFYKNELAELQRTPPPPPPPGIYGEDRLNAIDTVQVGWSRVNLLPPFTTPIAIDAKRGGKHFDGVHDSIYVRAFVFKQGNQKIAYVSADLLIIPPTVTKLFDSLLVKAGYDTRNIFFTATHTHTSIGAWHNSYVGELFAGQYDARVPQHIADCISKAILQAEKNCQPAKIGYGEFPTSKLVFNRLVGDKGKVDSMLRVVKIEQDGGAKAAIITFAAHCTVFHQHLMELSGDWAGLMMTRLNKSGKIDFASFSAGAVGSHGPYEATKFQEDEAKYMAGHVGEVVEANFDSIPVYRITHIMMTYAPFLMREPQWRINSYFTIRPWLFKKLFGDEPVYINKLQLGNIVFEGTPCDFSGELVGPIDSLAKSKNLHLLVTSFNGGYIGYVTDTKWYDMNAYETRTMGWFGLGNGDYMSEVMERLIAPVGDIKN